MELLLIGGASPLCPEVNPKSEPYLDGFSVGHSGQGFVVDTQNLVPDSQPLLLGQRARLHQRHIDAHAMLWAPADAEAQALVGLGAPQAHQAHLPGPRAVGAAPDGLPVGGGGGQVEALRRILVEEQLVGARDDQPQHRQQAPLDRAVQQHAQGAHQVEDVAARVVGVQAVRELLPLRLAQQRGQRLVQLAHVGRQQSQPRAPAAARPGRRAQRAGGGRAHRQAVQLRVHLPAEARTKSGRAVGHPRHSPALARQLDPGSAEIAAGVWVWELRMAGWGGAGGLPRQGLDPGRPGEGWSLGLEGTETVP